MSDLLSLTSSDACVMTARDRIAAARDCVWVIGIVSGILIRLKRSAERSCPGSTGAISLQ